MCSSMYMIIKWTRGVINKPLKLIAVNVYERYKSGGDNILPQMLRGRFGFM